MSRFNQIASFAGLYEAWRKVRANRGAAGIDSVSISEFEDGLHQNLEELSRVLFNKTYQPMPAKFVRMLKSDGKSRELAILTVRDRIAQRAVLDSYEAEFESVMLDCNFAFRPGRNVEMAIQEILVSRANGYWWTVEADIEDFFGSIHREILIRDTAGVIDDPDVLALIDLWINAGILRESLWYRGQQKISKMGAVVGETIAGGFGDLIDKQVNAGALAEIGREDSMFSASSESFTEFRETESAFELPENDCDGKTNLTNKFLKDGFWLALSHRALLTRIFGAKVLGIGGLAAAGIFLAPKIIEKYREYFNPRKGILQGSPLSPVLANLYLTEFDRGFSSGLFRLVRYCDDFVIACKTRGDAEEALRLAKILLAKRGLRIHPDKTRILPPKAKFDFLGYRFLSNGAVVPPPTVQTETAEKIRRMSKKVSIGFGKKRRKIKESYRRAKEFRVKKMRLKSWREFFNIFDKGKK